MASAAFPLLNLAILACQQGHAAPALAWAEESAALFRQNGNTLNLAIALWLTGKVLRFKGAYEQAQTVLQESLDMQRGMGARQGIADCLHELGYVAWYQGDARQAAAFFDECRRLAMEVWRLDLAAGCLAGSAGLLQATGEPQQAALLLGAAEALLALAGRPVHQVDHNEHERIIANVRVQLGEAAFTAAWRQGRTMDGDTLMTLDPCLPSELMPTHPPTQAPFTADLTTRERQVLGLLAAGLSNAEIAGRLVISQATVKTHVRAIYDKLGVHSRSAATRFALDHSLI
jgi:ATP/maltotriose-dependent transcriptional regulator MalT